MPNTLNFQVISGAQLSIQRHAILDLCAAAYQEDLSEIITTFPSPTHVLAYVSDQLVSHAAWVTRWLEPQDFGILRTAYIEAVATAPAHQGRGYASAVMRHLATLIEDYDLAALSPSDPAFYERFGWELWSGPLAIRTETGLLDTPDEEVMILRLPATPPLDLSAPITAEWRIGELW
jgi:aminoglycoside 2'-N-acetyltransferase I